MTVPSLSMQTSESQSLAVIPSRKRKREEVEPGSPFDWLGRDCIAHIMTFVWDPRMAAVSRAFQLGVWDSCITIMDYYRQEPLIMDSTEHASWKLKAQREGSHIWFEATRSLCIRTKASLNLLRVDKLPCPTPAFDLICLVKMASSQDSNLLKLYAKVDAVLLSRVPGFTDRPGLIDGTEYEKANSVRLWLQKWGNERIMSCLTALDLSNSGLTAVPGEINYLKYKILNLDLSGNQLRSCPQIQGFTKLRFLNLKNNPFVPPLTKETIRESVPPGIRDLRF